MNPMKSGGSLLKLTAAKQKVYRECSKVLYITIPFQNEKRPPRGLPRGAQPEPRDASSVTDL